MIIILDHIKDIRDKAVRPSSTLAGHCDILRFIFHTNEKTIWMLAMKISYQILNMIS